MSCVLLRASRPSSAATEWFDGEAARPPSRQLMRSQSQRVWNRRHSSIAGSCRFMPVRVAFAVASWAP